MRSVRSLRTLLGVPRLVVCATLALGLSTACGGGTGAAPTPTAPSSAAGGPSPGVASPQRPPLASPAASPSVLSPTPGAAASPGLAGGEETYVVQSGDTLLTISEQFYDDATQWRRIYDANRETIGDNPDQLKLGQQLKIPPRT